VDGQQPVVDALQQENVQSVRALAGRDAAAWKTTLQKAAAAPPSGLTIDEWAGQIADRVAATFPTDSLLAQLSSARTSSDTAPSTDAATRALNRYPGLKLPPNTSAQAAAAAIDQHAKLLDQLRSQNTDRELLRLDLSPGSTDVKSLNLTGIA